MRPSKAEPWRQFVVDALAKEPSVATYVLYNRMRNAGGDVGKSQFYELVADIRPARMQITERA